MATREELRAFLETCRSEMIQLAESEDATFDQSRWDQLDEWESTGTTELAAIEARDARVAEVRSRPAAVVPGDQRADFSINTRDLTYDISDIGYGETRNTEIRDRAMHAVEKGDGWLNDEHRQGATEKLEALGNKNRAAEIILAGSDPLYRSAYFKRGRQLEGGVANMDRDETYAFQRAQAALTDSGFYQPANENEARSMTVSNVTGVLVPAQLDPSIVLTNAGAIDPIRGAARVVPISTNVWTGVSSAGVTAEWSGTEGTAVVDASPTFASPAVTAYMADAFVPLSFQAYEDWTSGSAEIEMMFQDAKFRLEATAFATGTGSGQPYGIVTAITGVATQNIFQATNNAFVVADMYTTLETLSPRFRPNARFMMNLAYIDRLRQFATANNYHAFTVDFTAGSPSMVAGKPLEENSGFTSTLSTGTNNAIVYGDFKNYLIADRIGMVTEFIQTLHSTTTGMPRPIRGWLTHWRVGADSINDKGFVLSTNPNTAATGTSF